METHDLATLMTTCSPMLSEIAKAHGYELAVCGHINNATNLILVPWTEDVKPTRVVITAMSNKYTLMHSINMPDYSTHKFFIWKFVVANDRINVCVPIYIETKEEQYDKYAVRINKITLSNGHLCKCGCLTIIARVDNDPEGILKRDDSIIYCTNPQGCSYIEYHLLQDTDKYIGTNYPRIGINVKDT